MPARVGKRQLDGNGQMGNLARALARLRNLSESFLGPARENDGWQETGKHQVWSGACNMEGKGNKSGRAWETTAGRERASQANNKFGAAKILNIFIARAIACLSANRWMTLF